LKKGYSLYCESLFDSCSRSSTAAPASKHRGGISPAKAFYRAATMATHKEERLELNSALKEFAISPRFGFLKSIQVGPLLGDDASTLGALAEMTFEELVAAVDTQSSELLKLDEGQERLLVAVLLALAEGEATESTESEFDTSEDLHEPDFEGSTETTFNSVQCELELRDQVALLKAHPDLEKVADLTLGIFWQANTPRAPFEESLTIRQFLTLDLGTLAKKRSMTSVRMRSLAQALAAASHRLNGNDQKSSSSPDAVSPAVRFPPSHRRPEPVTHHKWHGYTTQCSPLEMALVESVLNATSETDQHEEGIFEALRHFCSVFSVSDFLLIMKGDKLAIPAQRKLIAWVSSGSLREVVPLLRMALQGPGTHISRVARLLQGHDVPRAIYGIAAMLIARGLNAHVVAVNGRACEDVWSSNPQLAPLLVRQALSDRQRSFAQALSSLCPELDPFLHAWLQGIVSPPKTAKKRQKRR